MAILAWQVTDKKTERLILVYAAESRGRAKYMAQQDAAEAGYDIPFVDFRAVRAPQYDEKITREGILGWEYDRESYGCLRPEGKSNVQVL